MVHTGTDDSENRSLGGTTGYQPLYARRNFLLRIVFIIMSLLVVAIIIIVVVICTQTSQVSSTNGNLPELEWMDLEVPVELHSTNPFKEGRNLLIPKGYGIRVYGRVPGARFLLALPNGDVLVSQPKFKTITLLQPPISPVKSAVSFTFASGLDKPHDMVLYTDEKKQQYIYLAEATRVARYLYKDGDRNIRPAKVIAENLPSYNGFRHPLKNIAIGNNTLYVSIGSGTNADPQDLQEDPKRGAIYGYPLTGGEKRLISEGVRNAEGLAFTPETNELWVAVNQRDNIKYPYNDYSGNYGKVVPEYVDNNPPEEFCKIEEGKNYGWPFCNPVASDSMNNLEYVADVDNNPNESVVKCNTFRKVDKGLESHSAPLGLTFWEGKNVPSNFKNGAIIALHGSWNRQSYSGHKVVFYPWINGKPGDVYDLVSGWIMDPDKKIRWGRPVDTAILRDGSILISDDSTGAIYQLYKKS